LKVKAIKNNTKVTSTLWLMFGAFLCYTGMYAIRKSFLAAQYSDIMWNGFDLKTILVISQVVGYMVSKFIGIKVISELSPRRRITILVSFISFGLLMLLIFYILPMGLKPIALFFNGLPLGMIFGVVFSYLEGRKNTELLAAALSATFIFSTGFVKTTGVWMIQSFEVDEFLMPFLTGAIFFPIFLISIWMLKNAGDPTLSDIQHRTKRQPMSGKERKLFFKKFGLGYGFLVAIYILLTIVRDFRDNFMVDFLAELNYLDKPELLTLTEIPVAIIVLVICALGIFIYNNYSALLVGFGLIITGAILVLVPTILFKTQAISPVSWIILSGVGIYLPYILFHCLIFERLIAWLRFTGNVGFLFYVADAMGYLGSVGIMLSKVFLGIQQQWISFFTNLNIWASLLLILFTVMAFLTLQHTKRING
jgi:MFS family permease